MFTCTTHNWDNNVHVKTLIISTLKCWKYLSEDICLHKETIQSVTDELAELPSPAIKSHC